jgi:RimJ/RimL family protein N-acetyltransferase
VVSTFEQGDGSTRLPFFLPLSPCSLARFGHDVTGLSLCSAKGSPKNRRETMFARTERLLLRPSWPEDAAELHAAIADEGIVRNLASAPWPYTTEEAVRFATVDHDEKYPAFLLMLRTDRAPRLIGACGLGQHDGEAELGYWIARPYWGLGFASEAGRAVMGIARAIGHEKVVASHFADNPASGNVLRKLGFRSTGRTEQRQSKGRGQAVTCALYEKPLVEEAPEPAVRKPAPALSMRQHFERLEAA